MVAAGMTSQVDRNYEAFKKLLPELLPTRAGKFALMRDEEIVEFFDTLGDAVRYGTAQFGDTNFSVQEVTNRSINLGSHSYALYRPAD